MKSFPPTCRPPRSHPYPSLCSPVPRFSKWGSLSCRCGRTFLVLFSSAFLFSPFFLPISTPFLEVVFGLGPVKRKEKGPVFLSRWKQPWNRQVHGPKQLLAPRKLKLLTFPSKPRALHIILSCNSHCNCRNPDCWGSSYYYYYDYYCCCCCFSLITSSSANRNLSC